MKGWRFGEQALEELVETAAWYEAERPGLGDDFLDEVTSALQAAATVDQPGTTTIAMPPGVRRLLLPRFPYAIILHAGAETWRVIAAAHLRRRPGYWRARLRK